MKTAEEKPGRSDTFNAISLWLGFVAANIVCLGLMAMLLV